MKTLKKYQTVNDLFVISYTDNLNIEKTISALATDIYDGSSISTENDVKTLVEIYVQAIPNSNDRVKNILINNGAFTIVGSAYPPILKLVSDLSVADKVIYDAFDSFIDSYTGMKLSSLVSVLNTNEVKINGITYIGQDYIDLVVASNGTLLNATMLAVKLLNEQ